MESDTIAVLLDAKETERAAKLTQAHSALTQAGDHEDAAEAAQSRDVTCESRAERWPSREQGEKPRPKKNRLCKPDDAVMSLREA